MAQFFIEDKYFEAKLPDGSIAFTRTKYIVDAIMYYRQQCMDIIESENKILRSTPKIMTVGSLEEMMNKIHSMTSAQARINKAETMLKKLDGILASMASPTPPTSGIEKI